MTLREQRNHYNIKLLSGYGISIKQNNNQIVLQHKPDPFLESEKEEWFVTKLPYEKIVISGKGYISTEAISLIMSIFDNVFCMIYDLKRLFLNTLNLSYNLPVSQKS